MYVGVESFIVVGYGVVRVVIKVVMATEVGVGVSESRRESDDSKDGQRDKSSQREVIHLDPNQSISDYELHHQSNL